MSTKFYNLKVQKIEKNTSECVIITFDVPQELKSNFDFTPGQYLNLEATIDNIKIRRSYSICSAPHDGVLSVGIKKVDNGVFSTYANDVLKEGDFIDVMPPDGNFRLSSEFDSQYVFFASGSGITPIMSMIKHLLETNDNPKVILFYGNRNTDAIIFREELEALKNKYLNRFSLHYVLSKEHQGSELFYGRINAEKTEKFIKYFISSNNTAGFWICGPSDMIFEVKEVLERNNFDTKNIHFELFNTIGLNPVKKTEAKPVDVNKVSEIKLTLDGHSYDLKIPFGGRSILDVASDYGLSLPYACKGGVCSTCKARVVSGSAEMDINYSLEPEELEAGYILTCQAHPRSEKMEIDFD